MSAANTESRVPPWSFPKHLLSSRFGEISHVYVIETILGGEHALIRASDGRLFAFGGNLHGQLGLGGGGLDFIPHPTMVHALNGRQITRMACGLRHSCVLDSQGVLFSFGDNSQGQLGIGDTMSRSTPTAINDYRSPIVYVACGAQHTLIIRGGMESGRIEACGANHFGQCGCGGRRNDEDCTSVADTGHGGAIFTDGLWHRPPQVLDAEESHVDDSFGLVEMGLKLGKGLGQDAGPGSDEYKEDGSSIWSVRSSSYS